MHFVSEIVVTVGVGADSRLALEWCIGVVYRLASHFVFGCEPFNIFKKINTKYYVNEKLQRYIYIYIYIYIYLCNFSFT